MSKELVYWSATELVAGYRTGAVSPVEATRAVLDQIRTYDSALNAFVLVREEEALAEAARSEVRWREGKPEGLVDGVPTTIKDIMLTEGMPTLKGSRLIDPAGPWLDDSPAVARLKEQGAVIVGKTTTPEFGWKGVTDSPLSGITRNPWNPSQTPGGSSGGAAAACAAGMGALHTGTDGGGSVRIPAAFSGIFGLKPSFGRVPAWPASVYGTVSHIGPMTRTVADAALMLQVMAGYDARDWYALPPSEVDFSVIPENGFKERKVAYSRTLGYATVDPEVLRHVDHAVELVKSLGAEVEEVDPGFGPPDEIFKVLWYSGASYAAKDFSQSDLDKMDPGLRQVVEMGREYTLTDFYDATAARAELGARMRAFHETYDLLLTPSLSVTAFEAGLLGPQQEDGVWMNWTPFSFPFNLTQQPACSVPCGLSADGLPIGMQIVGPMHADGTVLAAAAAFEKISPVAGARPDLAKLETGK
ncbi:amidase [Sneathiella chinensis]|uniref:Amidase n=1 Tax=Sneathiella chinensis TaxID=349750 RepID=A0ABQ5U623_9PROT|nr:amidase [Sneathiella chinensis]GLQ07153.1 amidase [Sneathiella chinensis]